MRYTAVFIALVLSLLGCGGSESDTDPPATTTSSIDSDETTTTNQPPTTADGSGDGSISPANCPELLDWAMDSVAASNAAFAGGGTNASGIEFTADYFQEFADRAPGEIRDDMQVFADAYRSFWDALADLGIDFTDPESLATMDQAMVQNLEAAAAQMETDEVEQALDNIQAYFERECS